MHNNNFSRAGQLYHTLHYLCISLCFRLCNFNLNNDIVQHCRRRHTNTTYPPNPHFVSSHVIIRKIHSLTHSLQSLITKDKLTLPSQTSKSVNVYVDVRLSTKYSKNCVYLCVLALCYAASLCDLRVH